jgi:phosphate transport system substrate-binding protein
MRFCDYGRGLEHPDIVVRFGRADPRLQACTRNGVEVVDLKVGYEAVVVARSKVYGALEMSARDVFLALAKEIPDPADPTTLIENPHDTWGEVNPALGYDRIEVVGPALDSATGKAFLALVLEAGCDTYPWIAGLEAVDRSRYLGICHAVRDDGAYQEMREGFEFMQRIETYPSVVGVFGYGSFERNDDKLAATILSGVAPTVANVAAGSYPASRTLHVHAKKENVQFIPGIWELVDDYLRSAELLGLVPPNSDERRAIHAKALDLKPSAP